MRDFYLLSVFKLSIVNYNDGNQHSMVVSLVADGYSDRSALILYPRGSYAAHRYLWTNLPLSMFAFH